MDKFNFNTGDILLYNTKKWYSKIIEYFLGESFSHISIILKHPSKWLDESLCDEEYYILESGVESFPDAISGKYKFGVQIVPFSKVFKEYKQNGNGNLYYRKLVYKHINNDELEYRIKYAYEKIRNKPYDVNPLDWIFGYYELQSNLDTNPKLQQWYQKTTSFWCSALVSYIFVECGLLDKNLAWTLVAPIDYANYTDDEMSSCEARKLPFVNNTSLNKMIKLC